MRVMKRGAERLELEHLGGDVVVRRLRGGQLIEEERLPRSSALVAKWEIDKRCAAAEGQGFTAASGHRAPLDHAALMAALDADPDDVDVYMVLADWLAERGDVWGELISVQRAIADLPRVGAAARRAELQRHEVHLLFVHSRHFWGPLGALVDEGTQRYAFDAIGVAWFLGFVREARIWRPPTGNGPPLVELIERFAELAIARLLRKLAVLGDDLGLAVAAVSERTWPHLESLELSSEARFHGQGPSFAATPVTALLHRGRAPRLSRLIISGISDAPALCHALASAPQTASLEHLELRRGRFDAAAIDRLLEVPFERLEALVITGAGLPAGTDSRFRPLARRVHIAEVNNFDDDDDDWPD